MDAGPAHSRASPMDGGGQPTRSSSRASSTQLRRDSLRIDTPAIGTRQIPADSGDTVLDCSTWTADERRRDGTTRATPLASMVHANTNVTAATCTSMASTSRTDTLDTRVYMDKDQPPEELTWIFLLYGIAPTRQGRDRGLSKVLGISSPRRECRKSAAPHVLAWQPRPGARPLFSGR